MYKVSTMYDTNINREHQNNDNNVFKNGSYMSLLLMVVCSTWFTSRWYTNSPMTSVVNGASNSSTSASQLRACLGINDKNGIRSKQGNRSFGRHC